MKATFTGYAQTNLKKDVVELRNNLQIFGFKTVVKLGRNIKSFGIKTGNFQSFGFKMEVKLNY